MISAFEAINIAEDTYRIRALKEHREDQFYYKVIFKPADNALNINLGQADYPKTYLLYDRGHIDRPNLASNDFKIKRGLYDVYLIKFDTIRDGKPIIEDDAKEIYLKQIMIGERYQIICHTTSTTSFNNIPGVHVNLSSRELTVDGHTIYYTIEREQLQDIKYYVPFDNEKMIDFFIQGVNPNEIVFGTDNDSFEIVRG